MKRSTDRILTTHVGSLIRPNELQDFLRLKQAGKPYDQAAYQACLTQSVADSRAARRPKPASMSSATASSASRSAGRNMCWSGCPALSAGRSRRRPPIRSSAAPTAPNSPNSMPSSMPPTGVGDHKRFRLRRADQIYRPGRAAARHRQFQSRARRRKGRGRLPAGGRAGVASSRTARTSTTRTTTSCSPRSARRCAPNTG